MLITVAVSHNRHKLLCKALANVAAQTYTSWKAVVADCPEWRAIILAVKLLLQHNKNSSPVH